MNSLVFLNLVWYICVMWGQETDWLLASITFVITPAKSLAAFT